METQSSGAGSSDGRDAATRMVRIVLWLLFAVLLLVGGWIWLRACGTNPILGLSRDYCPIPIDHTALQKEVAIGETLRRQVHQAEMKVAETPICPSSPNPQPEIQQRERQEIQRRGVSRGAKSGKLQITLTWETRDDLDLNLGCASGGRISSYPHESGPGICGDGTKDLDANRYSTDDTTLTPVENIFFKEDISGGPYTIEVIEFKAHKPNESNSVPFKLRIRWNDQERFCSGVVTWVSATSRPRDSEGLVGGQAQQLTWNPSDGLPDCNFVTVTTHIKDATK